MQTAREKISAFVVSYNRAAVLGTCLRALRFADEIIVVDKSSTDDSLAVAGDLADRVFTVPWSPTVEETRMFALSKCSHDWIVFLDDDECLSPEAARFIQSELEAPRADIYALPLCRHASDEFGEPASHWVEHHMRCFRRGSVEFQPTAHAGLVPRSDRIMHVAPDAGACIHHLSNPDVTRWIERANRHAEALVPSPSARTSDELRCVARRRIDHWIGRTRAAGSGGVSGAQLLRSVYSMAERLKPSQVARRHERSAPFRLEGNRHGTARHDADGPGGRTARFAGITPMLQDIASTLCRSNRPIRSEP